MHTINVNQDRSAEVRQILADNSIPFSEYAPYYSVFTSDGTIPSEVAHQINQLCNESGTHWDQEIISWDAAKGITILSIDPRPASQEDMEKLLQENTPVYGIEFTLPKLAHLIQYNYDGQHAPDAKMKAAIEVALNDPIPHATDITYAIVRPDLDSFGAIVGLELRRAHYPLGFSTLNEEIKARIRMIAKYDNFQFGAWPGPMNPHLLVVDKQRLLFSALNKICMDFKKTTIQRYQRIHAWITTGTCEGIDEAIQSFDQEMRKTIDDAEIVFDNKKVVALTAHTMGATTVGYCYAPVVVIANDKFKFPGVSGEHLKYTICQYQAGYIDLVGAVKALNEIEQNGIWGGSPVIAGSPQGVNSSLTLNQIIECVKHFTK